VGGGEGKKEKVREAQGVREVGLVVNDGGGGVQRIGGERSKASISRGAGERGSRGRAGRITSRGKMGWLLLFGRHIRMGFGKEKGRGVKEKT